MRRLIGSALLFLLLMATGASASPPWGESYNPARGLLLPALHGYLPAGFFDGYGTAAGGLENPSDLFVAPDGTLWVANTGKNRLVQFTGEGRFLREVAPAEGPGALREPSGVFVTADGTIYVADTGNARIAKFRADGSFLEALPAPKSNVLGKGFTYKPIKVVVDGRGYLYVASKGTYQGLIQLDPGGVFRGFFASNRLEFDLRRELAKLVATGEQREQLRKQQPPEHTNVSIDPRGNIYTTTVNVTYNQLKRLNAVEKDVLNDDRKQNYAERTTTGKPAMFRDVAIDGRGIMTAVDSEHGYIYQFDQEGNLLLVFGGAGDGQVGLFRYAAAIGVGAQGQLYVLDSVTAMVHLLRRTEFMDLVHRATELYHAGRHEEAAAVWRQVLQQNAGFEFAHAGLARALLKAGDYQGALYHYRRGMDRAGYSEAFAEARYQVLRRNFTLTVTVLVLLLAAAWALPSVLRRLRPRAMQEVAVGYMAAPPIRGLFGPIREGWRLLRNPADVYWELKWLERGTWKHGFWLLGMWTVAHVGGLALTSFHFTEGRWDTLPAAVLFVDWLTWLVPFVSWTVAQYLVSTITDGEGRFRDVFVGACYALMPYIVMALPLALLTNAITLEEKALYNGGLWLAKGLTLLLLFLQVMYTHNYSLKQALFTVGMGLFAMLVIWGGVILVYGLATQLVTFVIEAALEIMIR